jgi:hypothetical protein
MESPRSGRQSVAHSVSRGSKVSPLPQGERCRRRAEGFVPVLKAMLNGRQALAGTLILVSGFAAGYFAGQRSDVLRTSVKSPSKDASAGETLGPWKASFRIPGSVQVPQDQPLIKCEFSKHAESLLGFVNVTLTNLVDKSYVISYQVYGYDSKGRRISEGEDGFAIGPRERVVRNLLLHSQAPVTSLDSQTMLGSTFWLEVTLQQK